MAPNMTLYFRDIAGVITVVAAAFSLGRMVRTNELVAMIASGVSAKRIVGPILVLVIFFTALAVADQEFLIPSISDKLVRNEDDVRRQGVYAVWFIAGWERLAPLLAEVRRRDGDLRPSHDHHPTAHLARPGVWEVTGRISADSATFNPATGTLGPAQRSVRQHGPDRAGPQPVAFVSGARPAARRTSRCDASRDTIPC